MLKVSLNPSIALYTKPRTAVGRTPCSSITFSKSLTLSSIQI